MNITFPKKGGFLCIGNPFEGNLRISSLIPDGYKTQFKDGVSGQFNIQIINAQGGVDGIYSWCHEAPRGNWQPAGYWKAPKGAKIVPGDANDLIIKPGDGIYFKAPAATGDAFTLKIPCPYTLN